MVKVRKLRNIFLNKFTKIRKIWENCEKSSRKYYRILRPNSIKNLKTLKIVEKFVENLKIFYESITRNSSGDFESICKKKIENIKDFRNITKVVETS